jgi:hypothetical protein
MQGNSAATVEFLNRWAPNGPWVLTAIQPDKKGIKTDTFRPDGSDDLARFLDNYNGKWNLYFHVNPTLFDLAKKADRTDIKEVAWLHVDIDPRVGEDLQAEQRRALGLVTDSLPEGVPQPTVVVFSGGGYQAFWKLGQPIPVDGNIEKAEDAKRYNQQLEYLFGADNCHNIDRIMRLPGTVNIPDAKKKKKGREEALATLLEFNDGLSYDLALFTPAQPVQMPGQDDLAYDRDLTQLSGADIERLDDINELDKWGVSDRVKVIIVQGNHPEESKEGDDSRSSWLFDAVCQLVRAEVPDDVIYSILTDPGFGISESVLEKGANSQRYALKQITSAKEEAIEPWLRTLNDKFIIIGNYGGKCLVCEEQNDPVLNRTKLTKMSFDNFRNRYMHRKVQVGLDGNGNPKYEKVGHWWLNHPNRRQYEMITFAPGKDATDAERGSYNLWKGFACANKPGDCSLFWDHVENNVCAGNEALFKYLTGWMAWTVQNPAQAGQVAVVLRGGRGVGKSFFAKQFGELWGRHFMQVSNSSHLTGNFNSHLRDVIVLFADEAFYAGDKKHTSILKTLITEDTLTIEAKGVDAEVSPNYIHLIMASNDMHVIPAGGDERRFLVLDVERHNQQDGAYFQAVHDQMVAGGREALLHTLMTYDLKEHGFNVRDVPDTDALKEQKSLSLTFEESWWLEKLQDGRLMPDDDGWEVQMMKETLVNDFVSTADQFRVMSNRGNATRLGHFMHKHCPGLTVFQATTELPRVTKDGFETVVRKRRRFYKMPTLQECRDRWEDLYGSTEWLDSQSQLELKSA